MARKNRSGFKCDEDITAGVDLQKKRPENREKAKRGLKNTTDQ